MARLNVSATIHPKDPHVLLVGVEDESGDVASTRTRGGGGLKKDNFYVYAWAWNNQVASRPPSSVTVKKVTTLPLPDTGFFFRLDLEDIESGEDSPGQEYSYDTIQQLHPIVYTVAVKTTDDRGQAIACSCHPGEKPPR
jgi:hypothetical protein